MSATLLRQACKQLLVEAGLRHAFREHCAMEGRHKVAAETEEKQRHRLSLEGKRERLQKKNKGERERQPEKGNAESRWTKEEDTAPRKRQRGEQGEQERPAKAEKRGSELARETGKGERERQMKKEKRRLEWQREATKRERDRQRKKERKHERKRQKETSEPEGPREIEKRGREWQKDAKERKQERRPKRNRSGRERDGENEGEREQQLKVGMRGCERHLEKESREWQRRVEAARKALAGNVPRKSSLVQLSPGHGSAACDNVPPTALAAVAEYQHGRAKRSRRHESSQSNSSRSNSSRTTCSRSSSSRSKSSRSSSPPSKTIAPVNGRRRRSLSQPGSSTPPRRRSRSSSRNRSRAWPARGAKNPGRHGRGRGAVHQTDARGKGVGKGGADARRFRLSKALSLVLRHTAERNGITVRPDGYCKAAAVLALPEFSRSECTLSELRQIVRGNDKQRFEMTVEDGQTWVRAVQGHSMKLVNDMDLLKPLSAYDSDLPPVCVHGTYRRHVDSILRRGLIPGGGFTARQHVHFALCGPSDRRVISGMRHSSEVAVYLDLRGALRSGVPFYISSNQVILSPGHESGSVPPRHILKIEELASGAVMYRRK